MLEVWQMLDPRIKARARVGYEKDGFLVVTGLPGYGRMTKNTSKCFFYPEYGQETQSQFLARDPHPPKLCGKPPYDSLQNDPMGQSSPQSCGSHLLVGMSLQQTVLTVVPFEPPDATPPFTAPSLMLFSKTETGLCLSCLVMAVSMPLRHNCTSSRKEGVYSP